MKTLKLILILLFAFAFSCDGKLDDKVYRFQIFNESEDEIEISIFDTKTRDKIKTLAIARN
ncbi:hypothetical protein LCGC14_2808100, partial [marine sediment metagenome]